MHKNSSTIQLNNIYGSDLTYLCYNNSHVKVFQNSNCLKSPHINTRTIFDVTIQVGQTF